MWFIFQLVAGFAALGSAHFPTHSEYHISHNYAQPAYGHSGSQYGGAYGVISDPVYAKYALGSGSSGSYGSGYGHGFGGGSSYGADHGSSGHGYSSGSSHGLLNSGYGAVNYGNSYGGKYHDSNYAGNFGHTTIVKQTSPLVSKSTYLYSAPEDKEDYQRDHTIVLPRPKQHYNVVFIKAPQSTVINTPSTALGGKTQEKTLIYVVSDKKRIENRIEVPEVDQAKPQKPEVFFIKHNHPTQVVNSKIKYETVDAIHGADYGAVNGVPNRVSSDHIQYDAPSTPTESNSFQNIANIAQTQGIQSALNAFNTGLGVFNVFNSAANSGVQQASNFFPKSQSDSYYNNYGGDHAYNSYGSSGY